MNLELRIRRIIATQQRILFRRRCALVSPCPYARGCPTMTELLHSPFVFVLGILFLTVAVPVSWHYWCQYRRNELDAALKHVMLQRGMTAEEIKLVLEASSGRSRESSRRFPRIDKSEAVWTKD
jgi:hypothetical protein